MAEKKIAGKLFRVKQPLATDALKLQFRVMNMLAGSGDQLGRAIAALQAGEGREKAQGEVVSAVLAILGGMKPDDGARLISDLVAMAEIQGGNSKFEPADLDTEFSSDPSGLYQLVGFVLKEVLGPFISGLVESMSPAGLAADR